MKLLVVTIVSLFFVQCTNPATHASLEDMNQEVASARAVLKQIEKYNDSINMALSLFDKQINELLLLSKDVENPGACAVVANKYFEKTFDQLALLDANRVMLTPRMGKEEMEFVIRQNELFVLNELVFQNSGTDVRLHPVSENVRE